jgi:hypothetical protein
MSVIDWHEALTPFAPPAVVMSATPAAATAAAGELEAARPNTIVRTIDAAACSTTPELLTALGAALDFPDGSINWNVVEERLYDLTWFPDADAYVVIVLNCERFASASTAADLPILDRILSGLVAQYRSDGRALHPRLLVCQCDPARLDEFVRLLERHDVAWPAAPTP